MGNYDRVLTQEYHDRYYPRLEQTLRAAKGKNMTPNQIEAVRDILFIKRQMEDDVYGDSAIIRPETMKQAMSIAEVLSVGPDVADKYEVGDKVYIGKLAGLKITELSEGSYFLVNHNEILAKVKVDAPYWKKNGEAPDASGSMEFTPQYMNDPSDSAVLGDVVPVDVDDLKKL
jgi:co-chaperonin GroES (HSP10)